MRKFRIRVKENNEIHVYSTILDVDLGAEYFPTSLSEVIRDIMFDKDAEELLMVENMGMVTEEEYEKFFDKVGRKSYLKLA